MPKRNPVNLTPAAIVTFVLDAPTRKKFNEREYYRKNLDRKNNIKISTNKFYENNKETIKQKAKEYYEKNKETIKERAKEHYLKNRERLDELNKEWKKNHKEIVKAVNKKYRDKLKEKNGVCGCGSNVIYMDRHLKSKKHMDWAKIQN